MEKNKEIEVLRGFAIIAVVMIHIFSQFYALKEFRFAILLMMSMDTLTHFAVPMFFFISGFTLSKYRGQYNIVKFYDKRLKSIFVPYFVFSILYYYLFYILDSYNPPIGDLFKTLGTSGSMYHLWFFIPLVQLYLVFPIVEKIYSWMDTKKLSFVLLVLSIGLNYVTTTYYFTYQGAIYMFYLIFGIHFARHDLISKISNINKKNVAFLISLVSIITSYKVYQWFDGYEHTKSYVFSITDDLRINNLLNLFLVTSTILLLIILSKKAKSLVFIELGNHSFGIYLIHVLFIFCGMRFFEKVSFTFKNLWFYPVMIIFTLVLSYLVVKFLSYFEFGSMLVGSKSGNSLRATKITKIS